jgi:flagellar basal-body rod protein FlgF
MSSGLYVALSGQMALERRLETIANNVANMNTAGYRAEGVRFDSVLSNAGGIDVAFASEGESYVSRNPGPMLPTGNSLDVAVQGEGWLALETPSGTAYTRDGRMHVSAEGELRSVAGHQVLDRGGAPILIDPGAGPVVITDDGMITQGDRQAGALGLFLIPEQARLTRQDNSAVIPDMPAEAVVDMVGNGVRQGFVEGANVNPIQEMTRLIAVTRAFDAAAAAAREQEDISQQAIRTLGPTS